MGALRIGRLSAECQVSCESGLGPTIVDRATRALGPHLAGTLRSAFARWLDDSDESVWIVRRVDAPVIAHTLAPPDALSSDFAISLGRALWGSLQGDGDGRDTIRFESRVAYLAQFFADLAAGVAWGRWYYAPLAGLKRLPASSAMRTMLLEKPERGWKILGRLDDRALALVARALTPEDEQRVLDALADSGDGTVGESTEDVHGAALMGWAYASRSGVVQGRTLFATIRAGDDVRSKSLVMAVRDLEAASRTGALSEVWRTQARPISKRARREGDDRVRARGGETVQGSPALPGNDADRRTVKAWTDEALFPPTSRYAGLYLLLRDLDELPWEAWTAGWPLAQRAPAPGSLLKWLTLSLCSGRDRVASALDDGAIRALYGILPEVTTGQIARELRRAGESRRRALAAACGSRDAAAPILSPEDRQWLSFPQRSGIGPRWQATLAGVANSVLRRFARRLPGFADSTPEHLWRNFLDFEAAIEAGEDRIVVRCGRPPLHLLLALTGMTRGLVAGHDPRGRPVSLFPSD